MTEVEISILHSAVCEVVACNWEPLSGAVVRVITRVGEKVVPGLLGINQCLRSGLLELARIAPDGTETRYSKRDCEHRKVCAPVIHPGEGVRVELMDGSVEDGSHFIRRANPAEPTSPASEPAASAVEPPQLPQVESVSPGQWTADGKRKVGRPPAAWLNELYRLIDKELLEPKWTNAEIARRLIRWAKTPPKAKTILNVLAKDEKFAAWREKSNLREEK